MIKNLTILGTLFFLVINTSCKFNKDTEEQKVNSRPNIIYIMSDDHTSQAITAYDSIYGKYFSTPNIDKLADEGMRFDNVYCTNAICGPSRATIITGKYSHINGFYKNKGGGNFNDAQWTFPQALHDNGYTSAMVGKWHLGPAPKGFDYYMYHNNPGQQGYYWNPVYDLNGKEVKIEGYCTNITTDTAIAWIDKVKDKDQPFALLLQYKAPHREWSPDKKYENMYPNTDMPYPVTFYDDYNGREQTMGDTWMTMDFFNHKDMKLTAPEGLKGEDLNKWEHAGGTPSDIWMPKGITSVSESRKWKYQRFIKDYLACVKSVDDNVGRVLDYLKTNGLEENTLVIYTGDQGFYLGDHGLYDKRFMYETSMRMPFIMRYPEKIKPGTNNQNLISNVDFAPTILDLADIAIPKEVQGKSFRKLAQGYEINWDNKVYYHYYEWPLWHHVQPHYGMRTQRYKIIHFYHDIDVWELYDMKNDPDELNNLINDKSLLGTITKLKNELNQLMIEVGDNPNLDVSRNITNTFYGNLNW